MRLLAEWLRFAAYLHEQAGMALDDAADWLDR